MDQELARMVVSVDVVCFALHMDRLQLLLVKRAGHVTAYPSEWALPGGTVRREESLDEAAARILASRTSMASRYLEQLYTFGEPGRDPRPERSISVAYYALLPRGEHPVTAGVDVEEARWVPLEELPPLAFDHARIVRYAHWRLAQKLDWTPVAFRVVDEPFTLGELRKVYQAILGRELDPSNFAQMIRGRYQLERVDAEIPYRPGPRGGRPSKIAFRYAGPEEILGHPETVLGPEA